MPKVLVVDDSGFIRGRIVRIVKGLGHAVEQASSAKQALQMLEGERPDCIMTDILMPEMDGIELLGQLRADNSQFADLPVVVLTADIQDSTRERCEELGVSGFINKPPKAAEIERVLSEVDWPAA